MKRNMSMISSDVFSVTRNVSLIASDVSSIKLKR
jgi:hypothetical protein